MKYQIAIIGGGPAGYTAAEVAGKAGLSVVLFEKRSLGGVCLNEGCIPTKTLLYSAKVYDYAKHASKYAVTVPEASFDLGKIVARKSKVVRKLVLGIKAKLTAHQVNIVTGEATVIDKNTVLYFIINYWNKDFVIYKARMSDIHVFIGDCEGLDEFYLMTLDFMELYSITDHDDLLHIDVRKNKKVSD